MRVTVWIAALIVVAACARKPTPATAPPSTPTRTRPAGEMAPPLTRDNRTCGVETARLTGDRAGAIRLGMHVDSVKRVCRVVRDTTVMPEGIPQREIVIAVDGGRLRSWISDSGRVDNIFVQSPRFMTPDSLHVGTPLGRLFAFPDLKGAYGEGGFFVMSDAPTVCGLSFEIDFGPQRPPFMRNPTRETLEPYGTTAKVSSILVRRCFTR